MYCNKIYSGKIFTEDQRSKFSQISWTHVIVSIMHRIGMLISWVYFSQLVNYYLRKPQISHCMHMYTVVQGVQVIMMSVLVI
jgi:hypothetical protein